MARLASTQRSPLGGTLCRLVPLDTIDGEVTSWRVETGDLGMTIGSVRAMHGEPTTNRDFIAHMIDPHAEDDAVEIVGGQHATPQLAALAIANTYEELRADRREARHARVRVGSPT